MKLKYIVSIVQIITVNRKKKADYQNNTIQLTNANINGKTIYAYNLDADNCLKAGKTKHDYESVSYTHLDVYKRQRLDT